MKSGVRYAIVSAELNQAFAKGAIKGRHWISHQNLQRNLQQVWVRLSDLNHGFIVEIVVKGFKVVRAIVKILLP